MRGAFLFVVWLLFQPVAQAEPLKLQLSTLPPDCHIVDLDHPGKTTTQSTVTVERPGAGGSVKLRLLKPGYHSLEVRIPGHSLPPGPEVTWPVQRESFLRLEPILVTAILATDPEGAEIWHSNSGRGDDYLGLTGQPLQLNLAELIGEKADGFFRVRLSAVGYQSVEVPIPEHLFGPGRPNRWPPEGIYSLSSTRGPLSYMVFRFQRDPWKGTLILATGLAFLLTILELLKRYSGILRRARAIEQKTAHPDSTSMSGSRLGPYRLLDVLGQGGTSTVFRGCRDDDLEDKSDYAIKILKLGMDGPARLAVEVQPLLNLRHPNIVGLIDWGHVDRIAYLVMELVPGRTLRQELQHGPLNLSRWSLLADDLLSGLEHAHERGVTHGDIKPENILMPWHGKVKLGDFGTARQTLRPGLKRFGGTPGYMAPETLAQVDLTPLSDQFAAAVVLFEALLGEQPNLEDSETLDLTSIRGVLSKMKSKEPGQRFASIDLALERIRGAKDFEQSQSRQKTRDIERADRA